MPQSFLPLDVQLRVKRIITTEPDLLQLFLSLNDVSLNLTKFSSIQFIKRALKSLPLLH